MGRYVSPGMWLQTAGSVLLVMAAGLAGRSWWQGRNLVHTSATITENVAGFAPGGGVLYFPRFVLRDEQGRLVTVDSTIGKDYQQFVASAVVPVEYPRGRPQLAVIATVWRVYFAAIWLGVAGVALFDVGYFWRVRSRRASAR